jgi:hypothetical protein
MQVMRLPSLLLLVALVASLAVGAAPASAALSSPETLYLDAHDPANDGDAGPVSTTDVLATGVQYVADVSGTYNAWSPDVLKFHNSTPCGTVEAAPTIPSPGAIETVVGQDAETVFGMPWLTRFCPALPVHGAGFEVDTGNGRGFVHPDTTAGRLATPSADHSYSYPLVGTGQPARFRIFDKPTSDDNGILTIVVHPVGVVPATAGPATPAAAATAAPADAVSTAPVAVLPSNKTCLRSRKISLRLKARKGDAITAATVRVNGRTVRRVTRSRRAAQRLLALRVNVAGSRKTGTASVLVTARTRHGRVVVTRRVYKVCKR